MILYATILQCALFREKVRIVFNRKKRFLAQCTLTQENTRHGGGDRCKWLERAVSLVFSLLLHITLSSRSREVRIRLNIGAKTGKKRRKLFLDIIRRYIRYFSWHFSTPMYEIFSSGKLRVNSFDKRRWSTFLHWTYTEMLQHEVPLFSAWKAKWRL